MSPTILKVRGYRFFFFSNEERRMHVHVYSGDGEMKIWLEPGIEVAEKHGLTRRQVAEALRIVKERQNELKEAWRAHFEG